MAPAGEELGTVQELTESACFPSADNATAHTDAVCPTKRFKSRRP